MKQDERYQDEELFSSEGMPTIPLRKESSPIQSSWVYGLLLIFIGLLAVLDTSTLYTLIVNEFSPRAWFIAGVGVVALVVAYVQQLRTLFGVAIVILVMALALPFVGATQGAILPLGVSLAVLVCFVVFRILYASAHAWMLVVSGFALLTTLLMVLSQYGLFASRYVLPLLIMLIGAVFLWQLRKARPTA